MKSKYIRFEKMNSSTTRWYEVSLNSGNLDDDYNTKPYFIMRGFDYVLEIKLPFLSSVLTPVKDKDYSWDYEKSYGISLFEDHLNIRYGLQTDSSRTNKRFGMTLPWLDYDNVRITLLNLDYTPFAELVNSSYPVREKLEELVPKMIYTFTDVDGTEGSVTVHLEEREWRVGRHWTWRWLRLFKKPVIHRYIECNFAQETGREKGSWKGGTCSLHKPMEKLQTPLDCFKEWAKKEGLTNVQRIQ